LLKAAESGLSAEVQKQLGASYINLALDESNLESRATYLEKASGVFEQLAASSRNGPYDTEVLFAWMKADKLLGETREEANDLPAAVKLLESAFRKGNALVSSDEERLDWVDELSLVCDKLGSLWLKTGNIEAAAESFSRLLDLRISIADRAGDNRMNHLLVAWAHYRLAIAQSDPARNLAAAEEILRPLQDDEQLRNLASEILHSVEQEKKGGGGGSAEAAPPNGL
jgi:tetratricopeptide (TPR) repeat protein